MPWPIAITVCLLACAAIAALYRLSLRRADRAEAQFPPEGIFIEVEGIRLHYVRRGAGAVVVLLHGSDGFLQDFTLTVFDSLAREFDVIAFDRPGHGYSSCLPNTAAPDAQARVIHAALQKLGIEQALFVGHSWSGVLLMALAMEFPEMVRGLILLAPWVFPPASPMPLLRPPQIPAVGPPLTAVALVLMKPLLLKYHLAQAFYPRAAPPGYARLAGAMWQRRPWQTQVFAEENTSARRAMHALGARYNRLRAPTAILVGEADRAVRPADHGERLARELPNTVLTRLPGIGHEIMHTAGEEVLTAVREVHGRASQQATAITLAAEPPRADLNAEGKDYRDARALVFRYGWNAAAYQILNPDMEHWFTPERDAVVGYVRRKRYRIAAGAPVCAEERLAEIAAAFEADAESAGRRVCWFAGAERLTDALSTQRPHAALTIGAQPVWNPQLWAEIVKKNASLRSQIHRAGNKGVEVEEWPAERAHNHPGLQRCLDDWLATHPLPPLHFLTEAVSLARLTDRRIFVAESSAAPIGFLIATPVPQRNGWLIEQIVRTGAAPNGTAERMVDAAMRALGAGGADYVTLGLAPLSRRVQSTPPETAAPWVRLSLAWARAHGRRFYNFDGLDAFKAKFKPDMWEPLYAVVNEPRFTFRALYAIADAFSEESPLWAVSHAALSAVTQEFSWLRERMMARNVKRDRDTG